jgi:hypothetical protein
MSQIRKNPALGRVLYARGQIPLADRIVLGRCDEYMTGRYEKPGAGPGSMMDAYDATAKALRLTSTRIFVCFAPGGLQKDFAFGVVFFT